MQEIDLHVYHNDDISSIANAFHSCSSPHAQYQNEHNNYNYQPNNNFPRCHWWHEKEEFFPIKNPMPKISKSN